MANYKITFKHIEESTYIANIEADTEAEALNIFHDDPFDNLEDDDPSNVQGTDIVIDSIEKKED